MWLAVFLSLAFFYLPSSALIYDSEIEQNKIGTKYNVKLLNHPAVQLSGPTLQVFSKYGQPFSCKLPQASPDNSNTTERINNQIVHNLLMDVRSRCLSIVAGWWTYEVCVGHNISQYHTNEIDPSKRSSETLLGFFSIETDWDSNDVQLHRQTYHGQNYTNGEICDITSQPRIAEVRFACLRGEYPRLLSVEEIETCVYLIYIHVPSLCHYSRFRVEEKSISEDILCLPIVTSNEMAQFQTSGQFIRPSDEGMDIVDEKRRKSDNRVRTPWYTHKLIVSRRRRRERRQVKQLAQRLFSLLLHHDVMSPQHRQLIRAAVSAYFLQVLPSRASIPLAAWLWHFQLDRLSDGIFELAVLVERMKDWAPFRLIHLKPLNRPVKILIQEVDGLIQRASGHTSDYRVPIANLLESIALLKVISQRFILSNDVNELQVFAEDINRVNHQLIPVNPTILHRPEAAPTLPFSPDKLDDLRMLLHLLKLYLTDLQLTIQRAEKESLVNSITVHLENSVTNMISDLKDRVLVVRQPPRYSPNPMSVGNPYKYRKPRPTAVPKPVDDEAGEHQQVGQPADHEGSDTGKVATDNIPTDEVVFSRVMEKVFKKVLPGVSVFQAAPARPGSMEVLYIYSSEEKGKEDRRSSRQETAYQFRVAAGKTRRKEAVALN